MAEISASFLDECVAVLARTPEVLNTQLRDLPEVWTNAVTEGPGTWSPYVVIGHLIHGEKADWIPRIEMIVQHGTSRSFEPFDREAQFRDSAGKSVPELLDEFRERRGDSLARLKTMDLQPNQLELEGMHPAFGRVTLRQLLATWTAHDLSHIVQVSRVMARRFREDVGPWKAYLSVL